MDSKNTDKAPKIYFQFGGQGANFLTELQALYNEYEELHPYFEIVDRVIAEGIEQLQPDPAFLPHGFKILDWIRAQQVPPTTYLNQCTIALTGIHVTQSAYYHLLRLHGLQLREFAGCAGGLYGHSMGFHSAHLASLDLSGANYFAALRKFVLFVLLGGYRCQQVSPSQSISNDQIAASREMGDAVPTSMVATLGLTTAELEELLTEIYPLVPKTLCPRIALVNSGNSIVISGRPEDLLTLRTRFHATMNQRGIKWTYLDVSAPFHCHLLDPAWPLFAEDNRYIDFHFRGDELLAPVFSTWDGHNSQTEGEFYQYSFKLMTAVPLRWPQTVSPMIATATPGSVIIDCGPGRATRKFTGQILEEAKVTIPILTTTHRATLKQLVTEGATYENILRIARERVNQG